MVKQCKDCGRETDQFQKDRRNKDGLASYCKQCHYKRSQASRDKNKRHYTKYIREYMRKYRESKNIYTEEGYIKGGFLEELSKEGKRISI